MYKLDTTVKIIWTANYLMKFLYYSIIVLIIDFLFLHSTYVSIPFKTGIISLILICIGIIFSLVVPTIAFKYWEFEVKDNEIILQYGIINRIKTLIPYSKIQHIDVQQSIIERIYGLSRLILYTAGTKGADIVIPGLPIEYAEQLRDSLKDITANESL